jgi:predicted NAD-dependent protein-ADP-ribosyltransferase YbiA (DUF1768 family)
MVCGIRFFLASFSCFFILGIVDPNEVVTVFKATFPKAMEVLKRTITKIAEKDWKEILETIRKRTEEAVMKH